MTGFIILFLIVFSIFTLIDLVWLSKISPKLYRKYIGHLLADRFNLYAAGAFYFLNIFGLIYFAVYPAVIEESLSLALSNGGLFGLFTYATYDLTNLATLKKWPWQIAVIDICWGVSLSAVTCVLSVWVFLGI